MILHNSRNSPNLRTMVAPTTYYFNHYRGILWAKAVTL